MSEYIVDGSATLSKREAAFPRGAWDTVEAGRGPLLYPSNGGEYVDLVCALGALTVGHAHPAVVDAVSKQLMKGSLYSLPSWLEGHVAERLCSVIPSAEQVKFCKTGSEACYAAIRIARAAHPTVTGMILAFEHHYHGWVTDTDARKPTHAGIPDWMAAGVLEVDETLDVDALETIVASQMLEPCAMICEPERLGDRLPAITAMLRKRGLLVIYDETLSGGRLALGGEQERRGLMPDLSVFGKAFGGGLPLAFVCGPRELMRHAWVVSGTFSGDTLALAACNAMLDLYATEHVIGSLWDTGTVLKRSFVEASERFPHLGMTIHGHAPRFWLTFGAHVDRRALMSTVVQRMARRGVLMHQAVVFASAALEARHLRRVAMALEQTWEEVGQMTPDQFLPADQQYADSVR